MSGMAWADAPPCADGRPRDPLSSTHRQELEEASAIDPAVIAERGYRTLLPEHRDKLAMQGIVLRSTDSFPGLLLPMFRATGERISAQFKPAHPTTIKGKAVKYLSPKGQTNRIDVHPRNRDRVRDLSVPLWITEGIKKSDSLTSQGCCVAALTGVYNWRSKLGTLGDWEDIPLKGREVILCFDADTRTNRNVARAMVRPGTMVSIEGRDGRAVSDRASRGLRHARQGRRRLSRRRRSAQHPARDGYHHGTGTPRSPTGHSRTRRWLR